MRKPIRPKDWNDLLAENARLRRQLATAREALEAIGSTSATGHSKVCEILVQRARRTLAVLDGEEDQTDG